ncbi:hypothetical protein LJC61_03775 [Ruminococcaceae bacterium OttesenSCG-928-A16]|nr:hypothetical protein [Ruminococcaceae bacterium OttesenSCG-928-A16]
MKFKLNDQIAHPSDGACVVCAISEKEMFDKMELYYSLAPAADQNMTLFVPVESAEQIGLRAIISEQEADALLSCVQQAEGGDWVSDHNLRFKRYKELFQNSTAQGLRDLLMEMAVMLRKDAEKKLPNADKEVLRKIEKKAISEIAMAKNVPFETALAKVQTVLQSQPA